MCKFVCERGLFHKLCSDDHAVDVATGDIVVIINIAIVSITAIDGNACR